GRAGEQLALALEDGKMLGFQQTADRRNQDRRMLPCVRTRDSDACEQPRGEILRGNRPGYFRLADFLEDLGEALGGEIPFDVAAVEAPRFVLRSLEPPADALFHRVEPGVHRLLAALRAYARGIDLERHVGKLLAVDP